MINDVVHKRWNMHDDFSSELYDDNACCWESCITVSSDPLVCDDSSSLHIFIWRIGAKQVKFELNWEERPKNEKK